MADGSGRLVRYGIAKETSRGTAQTAATYYFQQNEAPDFMNKSEKIFNDSVVGVLNKRNASQIVKDWAEGKIPVKVLDGQFGLLLLAAHGTVNTADNADSNPAVKDHTFTQSQSNTPQAVTLFRKDGNSDLKFALGMLKSLEVSGVVGEFIKAVPEFVSKKGATQSTTPAFAYENEFKMKHAVVKMASTTGGLAGATAVPIKSFKFKIERKLNPYFVAGSNDPAEIFVEEFSTSGEIVLRYTDQTYENLHFGNTVQAISITLTNTDVVIGAAANPKLAVTWPRVYTEDWGIDQSIDQMVEQTLAFNGTYDTASSSEISAILTNITASY